jgi:hypothetical protein
LDFKGGTHGKWRKGWDVLGFPRCYILTSC